MTSSSLWSAIGRGRTGIQTERDGRSRGSPLGLYIDLVLACVIGIDPPSLTVTYWYLVPSTHARPHTIWSAPYHLLHLPHKIISSFSILPSFFQVYLLLPCASSSSLSSAAPLLLRPFSSSSRELVTRPRLYVQHDLSSSSPSLLAYRPSLLNSSWVLFLP